MLKLDTATIHLRDTTRWKATRWLTVVGGLDLLFQQLSGLARLPPFANEGVPASNDVTHLIETRLDSMRAWSPAGFAELELNPLADLYLSVGVRADYFSRISQATVAPRLVARYRILPSLTSLTIKGGAGLYTQEPQLYETDVNFGNPALKAERAVHLSAGLEWKPRPFVTLDGTFFYKDLSNLVSPTDRSVTDSNGTTRPLRYDNGGVGRVTGFEFLAKHDFSEKFAGWIAYTLSRSERRDSGATSNRLFDFDQTHILAAVATYQLPRNWQVGTRFRFVTGTPQTPVIGSIYNNVSDTYDPVYGAPNTSRPPPFHQLDIRVDKKWIYRESTATAYLDLQNVYNRANAEGPPSFNYDYTKSSITQGLPVLAILGFKVEF